MICLQITVTVWQRIKSADLNDHVWIFNLLCPLIEDQVHWGGQISFLRTQFHDVISVELTKLTLYNNRSFQKDLESVQTSSGSCVLSTLCRTLGEFESWGLIIRPGSGIS